jgi:hypothetical protein
MNASARTIERSRTAGAALLVLALSIFDVAVPGAARAAAGDGTPGLAAASAARTPVAAEATTPGHSEAASEARAAEAYGQLPMAFEPNVGQTDAPVRFLARGRGYTAGARRVITTVSSRFLARGRGYTAPFA